jgi:threonine dehydrogenase-like Zn-dependent dehydrogenase
MFQSDILPTGWQAAEYCDLKVGETVAIWGAGPVGLFAIKSAQVMGVICASGRALDERAVTCPALKKTQAWGNVRSSV